MATEQLLVESSLKIPAVEVIDLRSDGESETGNATTQRVTRDAPNDEVHREEEEGDEEGWESESLYADALEGMGDEHLFEGGMLCPLHPFTIHQFSMSLITYCRARCVHPRGSFKLQKTLEGYRRG